jgi:glycosyltransferase involved in cell wall biosynthesis
VTKNGDRDGIPNVMVESLAMGLPAVSTTVSALPEIVQPGKTGLLVEPDNPELFARAIETMLTNTSLRSSCTRQGLELVSKQFDNRVLIRRLAAIYLKAIPTLASGPAKDPDQP